MSVGVILWILAVYYFLANMVYLILYFFSSRLIHQRKTYQYQKRDHWPKISVAVSAYNEELVIERTIDNLLELSYPNLEVIVINDGSKDQTLKILESIKLKNNDSRLLIIDKANSGKADSLNYALKIASGDYFVTIDADTILNEDAFFLCVDKFLTTPHTVVVGGTLRILNGAYLKGHHVDHGSLPKSSLAMYQVLEYIRSFFGGRIGWESLGGTALISGAFSMFDRKLLTEINGFDAHSVTEDFEIIVRLRRFLIQQKREGHFHMIPNPVCWTIVPETFRDLFWQRVRWQKGLIKTLWKHKKVAFNPLAGRMGTLTLPYMIIFEAISPVMELLGYLIVPLAVEHAHSEVAASIVFLCGVVFYVIFTLAAVSIEELYYSKHKSRKSRVKFAIYAFTENFGYRQFLFVARLVGTIKGIFPEKNKWHTHDRDKFEIH